MTKARVLTCENGRRVVVIPVAVQPIHAPVPLTAIPVQVQNATVTARVPKDRAVKEDVTSVPVDLLLPRLGDEVLVLPEREEDVGVQADVIRCLETLELLLALDVGLAVLQHCHLLNLGEVQFGECDGASVCLIVENGPAVPDELLRVEAIAVDGNDLRLADNDLSAVPQERSELLSCLTRVVDDFLDGVAVQIVPVCVVSEDREQVQGLTDSDGFSHCLYLLVCQRVTVCRRSWESPINKALSAMATCKLDVKELYLYSVSPFGLPVKDRLYGLFYSPLLKPPSKFLSILRYSSV